MFVVDYQTQDVADELGWDIEKLFDTRLQEEPHLWMEDDQACDEHNDDIHDDDDNNNNNDDGDDDDDDDDDDDCGDADDCGSREPIRGLQKMIDIVRWCNARNARLPCSCD
jgi:hypothetical protein